MNDEAGNAVRPSPRLTVLALPIQIRPGPALLMGEYSSRKSLFLLNWDFVKPYKTLLILENCFQK